MKKIASMNKNEILSTLRKVARLQTNLINKLVHATAVAPAERQEWHIPECKEHGRGISLLEGDEGWYCPKCDDVVLTNEEWEKE